MDFQKYQHIERLGTEEVEGIELGACHVFPKIDGTNASIWLDKDGNFQTGSRNRWLAEGQADNAGFRNAFHTEEQFNGIKEAFADYPNLKFFGEWLVPHSLKTYKQDAWRKFYVFDVLEETETGCRYLSYDEYKVICDKFNIAYIPCINVIHNGTYDDFVQAAAKNQYLIEAGKGNGEGIVIKNYAFQNKFGRTTWAKIVTAEFKEVHYKTMGAPEVVNHLVEEEIANEYCTLALIDKTKAKIELETGGWSSKHIPRLLSTVFHELVKEESYNFVKKHKLPTVNFKTLNCFIVAKIKQLKPEVFS